mmetsp:Transcript_73449/g.123788  ORF Transcript_73449/g.123788 Transcript_73449/m.123788 type:complete len:274 (+) Transcript_73449:1225-2046(+)
MHVRGIKERKDLLVSDVLQHDHMLGQSLCQCQETPFGIEPRVRHDLAVIGLQGLDDTRDPELKIALRAVQSADHQVHNAQVQRLLFGIRERQPFLLLLDPPHHVLGLLVLARHDVAHAQVGEDDGRAGQDIILELLHRRLIVPHGLLKLGFAHEERVGHIQLPNVVLRCKLCGLAEDLLNHRVVIQVPVNLGLGHQDRDVQLQSLVVVAQSLLHGISVLLVLLILNMLGEFAQMIDVLLRQNIKLAVGLLWGGLACDASIQEIVQVLGQILEG